jgi:predicted nucleic acid-binding protein
MVGRVSLGQRRRRARLGDNARICANHDKSQNRPRPLTVEAIPQRLEDWLALPHVHIAAPSDSHLTRLRAQLERLGTAGNLTTDAHLAVLAMERGYVLYSTDSDFARFSGLRFVNPCK